MNKAELIAAVDAALGEQTTTAESGALVQQIVDTIARTVVAGEKVSISGFGVFEKQHRAARQARNPYSGESIRIKATSIPKFRPSAQFKDVVAGRRKVARTGPAIGRATATTKSPASAASPRNPAPAPKPASATKVSAPTKAATKKTAR